ncbi:zinc-ribbon domain-containing protein [Candidatus Pelagibacter communis]|uniref:zinc-ribbon domain-containing protein n=1 Tax=Candidatus Pelagibacter TaxID=198251 RepID=UPI003EDF0AEE
MIIDCICGKKKFRLADGVMPAEGSKVRCGSCSEVWFYHPNEGSSQTSEESFKTEPTSSPVEENAVETSTIIEEPAPVENPTETNAETPPSDDPEELLSTIDNDAVTKEIEEEKESEETVSNFKIFTDEEKEFPSKEEMDKNLDNFRLERDKNLNFFQKLFKKDRLKEAAKALEEKKNQQQSEEKNKIDVARRTRLLFYLLILLFIVFSVLIVPLREEVGMAFPFMEKYLEFLKPMYDYIKKPLGFE